MLSQKASDGEFYNGDRNAPSCRLMLGPVCLKVLRFMGIFQVITLRSSSVKFCSASAVDLRRIISISIIVNAGHC